MPKERQTEQAILATGQALIQTVGVNGFSFADIATQVGIRKASIYYYFPTKQALVAGALTAYTTAFLQDLATIDPQAELTTSLLAFTQLYRRNLADQQKLCLCTMLASETPALTPELREQVNAFFHQNVAWLTRILTTHGWAADQAASRAQAFFTTLQGAQLITRSTADLSFFDTTVQQQISVLAKS